MDRSLVVAALAVLHIACLVERAMAEGVVVGFYASSCPDAETIIQQTVQRRFTLDKTITPALLRMFFHDAFIRGADASILLDSTPTAAAEKTAGPNLSLRGFDLIDEAKAALEAKCPGIVSCADIIALAVRDSVALAGGPKYAVPTGRRDGMVSLKNDTDTLPSPGFTMDQAKLAFSDKGLEVKDLAALLGAHTVGSAMCSFFNDRIFNFHGTGAPDPAMSSVLATRLQGVCPNPFTTETDADPPINLDQGTPTVFDVSYYRELQLGNSILEIDQELIDDPSTSGFVTSFTSPQAFFPSFVQSIIKMGNIGVLTGSQGEVRKKCNVINGGVAMPAPPPPPPSPPLPTFPPLTALPAPSVPRAPPPEQFPPSQLPPPVVPIEPPPSTFRPPSPIFPPSSPANPIVTPPVHTPPSSVVVPCPPSNNNPPPPVQRFPDPIPGPPSSEPSRSPPPKLSPIPPPPTHQVPIPSPPVPASPPTKQPKSPSPKRSGHSVKTHHKRHTLCNRRRPHHHVCAGHERGGKHERKT